MISELNNPCKCKHCGGKTEHIISMFNSKKNWARTIKTDNSDPTKHAGWGRDPDDTNMERLGRYGGKVPQRVIDRRIAQRKAGRIKIA